MAALLAIHTIAFAYLVSVASSAVAPGPVTYIFGDSMADVGNNNFFPQSLAKANYPWYGIDYSTKQPTGRFTNGRTIGDVMSAKFGVPPPPAYLSLSMNDDAILKGINFASGGAGILNETGSYFVQYLSFDAQISYFEKTKEVIKLRIGEAEAEKLCNDALYLIGLGSNDYINNFLQPFMADGQAYTHDEFIVLLNSTLNSQLMRLYGLGARKVVFNGIGPLGCIPSQRVKSGNGQCLHRVNQYVKEFNAQVTKLLMALNAALPGAQMILADSYPVVMELIDHPEKYGFKISTTSCCNVDSTVGGMCLPNSQLCANRRDYVFWDAYHTSDAANEIIANKMFADLSALTSGSAAPAPAPGPTSF
ncbi:GDSL esterase/lipase [Carex littledalei]|uniref:GDSL esterase/lipase n=1 Tax=Carex littledalei TaxID=544730 RepID=A0A833R1K1_9POAL|nr:GDSL esterase/lipase [Carex littledalei]